MFVCTDRPDLNKVIKLDDELLKHRTQVCWSKKLLEIIDIHVHMFHQCTFLQIEIFTKREIRLLIHYSADISI